MVGVSTVALIERKPGISRDLFSRYWRDVHGVMATRIPGFESYTQYHVTPLDPGAPPFEGIAIVTFASEEHRQGLATSDVTRHIHRDEQNVFRRALLYNLDAGARRASEAGDRASPYALFLIVPEGGDPSAIVGHLRSAAPVFCDTYDLTTGDPAGWNDTDISGQRFTAVIHAGWSAPGTRDAAVDYVRSFGIAAYMVGDAYLMVDDGVATPIGLRGLDAVRTITEIGATNQLAEDVAVAIYGSIASRRRG